MATIKLTLQLAGSVSNHELGGDPEACVCATLLGGLIPVGGMRKVALGDLKVGDKFRCPHDQGPEVEVISIA